jgi:hypothetical protein
MRPHPPAIKDIERDGFHPRLGGNHPASAAGQQGANKQSEGFCDGRKVQMQAASHDHPLVRTGFSHIPFAKGIGWGLMGGLIATLVMDLILMGSLVAAGLPAFTCFSIIGDTVARVLSPHGIAPMGSFLMGVATHYLVGPLMGAMFGAAAVKIIAAAKSTAVAKVDGLRVDSVRKMVVLAVLYAEILSQPLLAMSSILLRMTASETLQWFGGSMVMHIIWGCVLGIVWSLGLRLPGKEFSIS